MTFSDPSTALLWVRDQWSDFRDLDVTMLDLQHRAAELAATTDDPETAWLARSAVDRLARLREWHDRAVQMFGRLREAIPSLGGLSGVWVWGAAAAATALALGALVAWIQARLGVEQRIVDELLAGSLAAEDAAQLLAAVGDPPSPWGPARWIILGILGLAAWRWWSAQ